VQEPLEAYRPRVIEATRRKILSEISLEEHIESGGTLAGRILVLPDTPLVRGRYRAIPREEGRRLDSLDPPLLIYEEDEAFESLFRFSDFLVYRNYFEAFHPIKPRRRSARPSDSRRALEGILREMIGRHEISRRLRTADEHGEFFDEYQGRDLILKEEKGRILKRQARGNVVILQPDVRDEAKFGYAPIAELDGLLRYSNHSPHIYVIETKQGRLTLKTAHLTKTIIPTLKQFFPDHHIHYLMLSHHRHKVAGGNRSHRFTAGYRGNTKEAEIALATITAGATPVLLDFGITRERFSAMTEHLIREYHALKHLDYAHEARASLSRNLLVVHDASGRPLIELRKNGKGSWIETTGPCTK